MSDIWNDWSAIEAQKWAFAQKHWLFYLCIIAAILCLGFLGRRKERKG